MFDRITILLTIYIVFVILIVLIGALSFLFSCVNGWFTHRNIFLKVSTKAFAI